MTGDLLNGRWLLVLSAVVVVLIALGLFAVGGPETARMERLDQERQSDLKRIERALIQEEGLPTSLGELSGLNEDDVTDPSTGEPYGYRVVSDSTYELCATFALSSTDLGRPVPTGGRYEAGRHCFVVDWKDDQ